MRYFSSSGSKDQTRLSLSVCIDSSYYFSSDLRCALVILHFINLVYLWYLVNESVVVFSVSRHVHPVCYRNSPGWLSTGVLTMHFGFVFALPAGSFSPLLLLATQKVVRFFVLKSVC